MGCSGKVLASQSTRDDHLAHPLGFAYSP
jgi:hypothetical protein